MNNMLSCKTENQIRLDLFLSTQCDLSRTNIQRLIKEGQCKINGQIAAKPSVVLVENTLVELCLPGSVACQNILPQDDIDVDILYQDDDIAVINKQQGLSVHPSDNITTNTLVNALLAKLDSLSGINGIQRPGIVHRLDKQTSGVLVVAKNDKAHTVLSQNFADRKIKKIYLGVVEGLPKKQSDTINAPIGRHQRDRKKMAIISGGRHATTKYKVQKELQSCSLLEFDLLTGRTHQIRVHCKHIGHPIVGDEIYGNLKLCKNQLLHAHKISFNHPITDEYMRFVAPLPKYFEDFLNEKSK